MKRADIEALQLRRLKWMVDYCYNNVPFYHERLGQAGVTTMTSSPGFTRVNRAIWMASVAPQEIMICVSGSGLRSLQWYSAMACRNSGIPLLGV